MKTTNRIKLFFLLRRNERLGFRRSPSFEQSMVTKVLMMIGGGMFVIYLILYGVMFSYFATQEHEPAMLMGIMPLMLLVDFGIRFMVQQTPAMLVVPYLLLPMPRKSVIDSFLVSSVFSGYNLLWLSFFLPYFIIVLAGGCDGWLAMGLLLGGWLMIAANSQFYLMVRTLVARSFWWWALPIVVYGAYFAFLLLDSSGDFFGDVLDGLVTFGSTVWMPCAVLLLLGLLLVVNRRMQWAFAYEEVSKQEKNVAVGVGSQARLGWLERFGEVGEYLKLEVKSIMRCKAVRSLFVMSLTLIVAFSAMVAYTSIYDGLMMRNFLCYYCFAIYGVSSLVKIMGPEGNYIDLLMVHRENVLQLLRAKYYFHCAILVVPFIVMLPAVVAGKYPLAMMLAYMLLTSGLLYGMLFQLAVYNKQTMPLEQRVTGKSIVNGLQLVIELDGMLLPIVLMSFLLLFLGEEAAYGVAIAIGLVLTLLHPVWLRHVYRRMMRRKYENLEGFHASR